MITHDQELTWLSTWPHNKLGVMQELYIAFFPSLWSTSFRVLGDRELAEDMVQEVMMRLWEQENLDHITRSLGAYLHRAVLNRSLNKLRELRRFQEDDVFPESMASTLEENQGRLEALETRIRKALEALPERCRLVFVLSRYEHLSNQEIADVMEISIKTVENQMTKALKWLREQLVTNG